MSKPNYRITLVVIDKHGREIDRSLFEGRKEAFQELAKWAMRLWVGIHLWEVGRSRFPVRDERTFHSPAEVLAKWGASDHAPLPRD